VYIAYHSATTNAQGVRAHTVSSATFAAVKLNDVPVAESGINAAIAGHFGIPVVAISGDDAAVAELTRLVPGAEGAVVKRASIRPHTIRYTARDITEVARFLQFLTTYNSALTP